MENFVSSSVPNNNKATGQLNTEQLPEVQNLSQAVSNPVICTHQYGQVTLYEAITSILKAVAEQESKRYTDRAAQEELGGVFEYFKSVMLNIANSSQQLEAAVKAAADKQVARLFTERGTTYQETVNTNTVAFTETGLDCLVQEVKNWGNAPSNKILSLCMDDSSIQAITTVPNKAFFWLLFKTACIQFPIQSAYMKHAIACVRNEFLLQSQIKFGKPLPLFELWCLSQRKSASEIDSLLKKTLSYAEFAYCLKQGALCLKEEPVSIEFNPIFIATT